MFYRAFHGIPPVLNTQQIAELNKELDVYAMDGMGFRGRWGLSNWEYLEFLNSRLFACQIEKYMMAPFTKQGNRFPLHNGF